jgi:hypothetical protein
MSNPYQVGIVVARRRLTGPWADHAWLPVRVTQPLAGVAAWSRLGQDGADELFYAGEADITPHPMVTAHYIDNLAGTPSIWVCLNPTDPGMSLGVVTLDPYEGEALTDGLDEIVEAVPMPDAIEAALRAFIETHHVERRFDKRKRDRADPEALGRRRKT